MGIHVERSRCRQVIWGGSQSRLEENLSAISACSERQSQFHCEEDDDVPVVACDNAGDLLLVFLTPPPVAKTRH